MLDQGKAKEIKAAGEKVSDVLALLMTDTATQALIAEKMKEIMEG